MAEKEQNKLSVSDDSLDIFAKFDQLDDQLIIDEIEKRIVDVWVYHFTQDKKDIWGLGKVGVDQCTALLGKKGIALRDDTVWFQDDPKSTEHIIFFAKVNKVYVDKSGNEARVESAIAAKRQWIMRKIKMEEYPGYRIVQNQFWPEQGTIKALRNAKLRLIPEEIKAEVIANAKQLKKVKTIEAPEQQSQENVKTKLQSQSNEMTGSFPAEQGLLPEESEQASKRKASQNLKMKVNRYIQTLVDKFRIDPDQILEKMDEKIGTHDINDLTEENAIEISEYFEWAISELEPKK